MDAELFLRDLEAKPEWLRSLADGLDAAPVWGAVPPGTRRVVLIGMGSSRYAAAVIAARLRASGVHAVAEYASAEAATPGGAGTVAIGISASGKTEETTAALRAAAGQGALGRRQGPRLPAHACETADWLHVDVYLTKSLDYRALFFAGSRFDDEAMGWMRDRGATVVAVGDDIADAKDTIRYPGDDDPEVALLTEVLVPELVAADVWGKG